MRIDLPQIAGLVAGALFVVAQAPMLIKAFRTKDLNSYSPTYILIAAVGNVIYWPYVISLPFGAAWFIHVFMSLSTWLMLFFWWKWRENWLRESDIKK
jgi:uncharacterized membrane protein